MITALDFEVHDALGVVVAKPTEAAAPGQLPWKLPVAHLSASSLQMAMRCPRQWQERYIHHRKERPGAAVTLGSAEWGAQCINYEQKMITGEDLPDISDAYATAWDTAVEKNGGSAEIMWDSDKGQTPSVMQSLGLKMAQTYHAQVSPRIQPLSIEQKIAFPVRTLPVEILGFIDLVKLGATVEHKTGKAAMKKPKSGWRFQQHVYSIETKLPGEIHLVTKSAEPKVVTPLESHNMFLPYNAVQSKAIEKVIESTGWYLNYLFVTHGPDEPWPQTGVTHDWACDYCAYRPQCPAWRLT